MPKSKRKIQFHPFLYANGKVIASKKEIPVIGLDRVKINRHHLYPKSCEHIPRKHKDKFLLQLWNYKHFMGWNPLF